MIILTKDKLNKINPEFCSTGLKRFNDMFPKGMSITKANLSKYFNKSSYHVLAIYWFLAKCSLPLFKTIIDLKTFNPFTKYKTTRKSMTKTYK